MVEAVGLAPGAVATWKTCIDVFDIVDSGRKYGVDYEILRVKLEFERARLLMWGTAVGLASAQGAAPKPEVQLHRGKIRDSAMRLLGGIHRVFDNTTKLQDRYGLRPVAPAESSVQPAEAQLILGSIFKCAYNILRSATEERQRETQLFKKTLWAMNDREKFQQMVTDVKGFNDGLANLFPEMKAVISHQITTEIEGSEDESALALLQEAAKAEHEDISDCVRVRLETLRAVLTAKSRVSDSRTEIGETSTALDSIDEIAKSLDDETDPTTAAKIAEMARLDGIPVALAKELLAVEALGEEKSEGCLTLAIFGPNQYVARVTGNTFWTRQNYDERLHDMWDDGLKGFVKTGHAAFDLYKVKKYMSKARSKYDVPDEEHNLLDVECHPKHENENPGTVTVEGFGLECWDYEIVHGPRRDRTYIVTHSPLPDVPAKKVLRRIDELRRGATKFGWNPDQEEFDLQEFFGLFAMQSVASRGGPQMYDFYSLANRDLFIDYATGSSIALEWNGSNASESTIWNILWQVILGKEMAMRLQNSYNGATNGFTNKIHTTLIVQDLWLQNVELVIMDQKLLLGDLKKPETREEAKRAEKFYDAAKKALKKKKYQEAADLFTEAMRIDLSKPAYRSGRAAALLPLKKSAEAEEDAWICKELDPSNPEFWSQLGTAQLQRDKAKKAKVSFQRALDLAGKKATKDMKKDLEEATKQVTNQLNAIEKENNKTTRDRLRKDYLDQDWDLFMGKFEFHSTVHQRQVEGLLLFAEKMKWPYINETRDHAEGIYQDLRAGKTVPIHLYDWIFGLTLPGKWMSFKIMSALIIATPSVYAISSTAAYFDCGLVIPRKSYWRLRTVLGRVLGALPGVTSLCGWIGPCPAVEFDPPLQDPSEDLPRHIHLSARPVAPLEFKSDTQETIMGPDNKHDRRTATRIKEGEDEMSYLLEMKDKSKWFAPASPVRDLTTVTVAAVRLKKLPLDSSIAAELANKSISEEEARNSEKYRASIAFTFDNNTTTVTYTLYTNPVFVTPPACYPPAGGTHHIHEREKHLFDLPVWTVDQLKNHTPDDDEGGVMVINTTGKGAEVVARAWCAERGKCAIVRKAKGPCYVCAVTAASRGHGGLGFGVLIWAS